MWEGMREPGITRRNESMRLRLSIESVGANRTLV